MAIWQVSEQIPSGYGLVENVLMVTIEADTSDEAIEVLNSHGLDVVGISEASFNIVVGERK